ncbi:hypothetical protein HFD88_008156 [Aspergillus terreus]|nr:hypothetical protein HFD88_008156 [Aspergillus terreus]
MFLDLGQAHHSEFITKLKQSVQGYGFKWEELRDSEEERRQCATNFTLEFGPLYWGTAEGREKYLDSSALKRTAELCVYPRCKEEIISTIMILLERKAKSYCRTDKQAETSDRPTTTNLVPAPKETKNGPSSPKVTAFSPQMREDNYGDATLFGSQKRDKKRDKKKKRRETEEKMTSVVDAATPKPKAKTLYYVSDDEQPAFENTVMSSRKRSVSTPRDIRPFSAVASGTSDTITKSAKRRKLGDTENIQTTPAVTKQVEEEGEFWKYTKFLVSSSNQQMAPVWVPFTKFISSSMFLAHMADECQIPEMGQAGTESSNWHSNIPTQVVVAASIKFEWSNFEIRVRQGQDRDLEYVMTELEDSWKNASEERFEGGISRQFKVLVMLHMVG